MAVPPSQVTLMRATRLVAPLAGLAPVQSLLKGLAGRFVAGPSAEARETGRMQLWGRVEAPGGRSAEGTLETPEGYALTAVASVEIAERVRAGDVAPGAWTPGQAFGGGFVAGLPGCDLRV